jgi:hypothetical protein
MRHAYDINGKCVKCGVDPWTAFVDDVVCLPRPAPVACVPDDQPQPAPQQPWTAEQVREYERRQAATEGVARAVDRLNRSSAGVGYGTQQWEP